MHVSQNQLPNTSALRQITESPLKLCKNLTPRAPPFRQSPKMNVLIDMNPPSDSMSVIIVSLAIASLFAYLWDLTPFTAPAAFEETSESSATLVFEPKTPAFEPKTPPFEPQTPPYELLQAEKQIPPLTLDTQPPRSLRQSKIYRITSLSIDRIKEKIIEDPSNLYLKDLLLKKLQAKGEQKCVASYSKLDKNTGLVILQKIMLPINSENFIISTTKGRRATNDNQRLRIHLTKAALNQIKKKNSHLKNLKVYE